MDSKERHTGYLEEVYISLRQRLNSIANLYKVTEEEAEDLIQEGYLRLMDKKLDSKDEANGKYRITIRNLSIDRFRRQKFNVPLEASAKEIESGNFVWHDKDRILQQMQNLLTPFQFKIMKLLVVNEMEYEEIAKVLNMKEGTVRTNVSRARKLLKEKMER